jgi:Xaa-Pro aminopeptidase
MPWASWTHSCPNCMENRDAVWYPFAIHQGLEARVGGWLNQVRARVRYGALCPEQQRDLCGVLDEMRLIKDAHEQDVMRRAAAISARAHIRAMQLSARMLREGKDVREYHLDAELLHEFRLGGSQYPAYGSIVAAGANACVLHYRADAAPVRTGELVLIDAGCELDGYASDITRTFPANGNSPARSACCTTWCWRRKMRPWPPPSPARASTTRTTPRCACWPRACWTWACWTGTRWARCTT